MLGSGKLFRWTFLSVSLALWIPIMLILSVYGIRELNEQQMRWEEKCVSDAGFLIDKVHTKLANLASGANGVFYSRWYEHFINSADIYRDEFDVLKKNEISYQLRLLIYTLDFAVDVMVISPDHDTVATTQGWYSIQDYNRFYGRQSQIMINTENSKDTVTVNPTEGYRRILLPDVTTRLHRAYVCVLLDETKLTSWVRAELPETLSDIELYVDGNIAVSAANPSHDLSMKTVRYGLPMTEIAFEPVPWTVKERSIRVAALALQLLTITMLLAVVVWIVVWFMYKPVSNLLRRLPHDESRSFNEAIGHIGELMDAVVDRSVQISDENLTLKRKIDNFVSKNETELLLSLLLTRPEMGGVRDIPAGWEESRYIIALIGLRASGMELPELSPPGCRLVRVLHILSHEYCVICWLEPGTAWTELPAQLCIYFDHVLPEDFDYLCSPAFQDIRDLHMQYEMLQNSFHLHGETERMLPFTLQITLLAHIKAGRFESAVALVDAERDHWEPSDFFAFLLHAAYEAGVDTSQFRSLYRRNVGNEPSLWNIVIEFTSQLCRQEVSSRRHSADSVASLMRAYIDENYQDPDLSVKLLAERFHIDSTQVSKIFKAQMDTTFSDYLLEKRINMAISLMSDTSMSLLSIAEAVGYSNYLTFKRAFLRLRGMSPRDYRQLFSEDAEEAQQKKETFVQ